MSPARKKKSNEVGSYRHSKVNIEVPISFDKNDKDFVAKYGDQTFRAKTYDECHNQIRRYVEASLDLKWEPVIEVRSTVLSDDRYMSDHQSRIGISTDRFYLAPKPNTKPDARVTKLKVSWGGLQREKPGFMREDDDDVFEDPISWASDYWEPGNALVISYTESMWAALEAIKERIDKAAEDLQRLLKAPELPQLLERIAAHLPKALPPAEPAEAEVQSESFDCQACAAGLPCTKSKESEPLIATFTISDDPETIAELRAMGLITEEEGV